MRFLIYGFLILIATLMIADTNFGKSLENNEIAEISLAIDHLESKHLYDDAKIAKAMIDSNLFRKSRIFENIVSFANRKQWHFSYYGYTPVFSTSRVFIGERFWDSETIGQSSVIIHELAHIRHHRNNLLRGIPRHIDEGQAYLRQYVTYQDIGLTHTGIDGTVFWDMMIGVEKYTLPLYPKYAEKEDIRWAIGQLDEEVSRPMPDIAIIIIYIGVAAFVLIGGDLIGAWSACKISARCRPGYFPRLGEWILIPIALLVPLLVLVGFLILKISVDSDFAMPALANNLEILLLAAFFVTGFLGGFLTHRRRD